MDDFDVGDVVRSVDDRTRRRVVEITKTHVSYSYPDWAGELKTAVFNMPYEQFKRTHKPIWNIQKIKRAISS